MNKSIKSPVCEDKDFFYLADAIDASPRTEKLLPVLQYLSTPEYLATSPEESHQEEEFQEEGPRLWNPAWPSRAEWIKMQYLNYQALSPASRIKADWYRARSEQYWNQQRIEEENERYRSSITASELDRALDKFQTLLPPNHIPGTNPNYNPSPVQQHQVRRVEVPSTPTFLDQCNVAYDYNNHLARYQAQLAAGHSTPIRLEHVDELVTPTMTRKSSTMDSFQSFLTFVTPKTIGSLRQKRDRKRGKASFTVL